MGQRGQEPAEVNRHVGALHPRGRRMNRGATMWLALGWVGFALLPWHLLGGGWLEWLARIATGGPPRAAHLPPAHRARWLCPDVLPLFLAVRAPPWGPHGR